MEIHEILLLIEKIEDKHFTGPCNESDIISAEKELCVQFPKSYRQFLARFGAGDFLGIEICGVKQNNEPSYLNVVWTTLQDRESVKLPNNYIHIADTGYGPYYVIDTSQIDDYGESPVYMWDVGDQSTKEANSFSDFLYSLLEEVI